MQKASFLKEALRVARASPLYWLLNRRERRQVVLGIYGRLLRLKDSHTM
jgi:hypothetical protein